MITGSKTLSRLTKFMFHNAEIIKFRAKNAVK